jgi:4a-hydroxytetrahydrobiopterin dehydratase
MAELKEEKCVACRVGAPRVTQSEIAELKPQVPEWNLVTRDGIDRLERVYPFKDFAEALSFTVGVGDIAESEGHHPAILTEWGRVTVSWWTHKIGGLHHNDFIMAAKTDMLYAGQYPPIS